MTHGKFLGGWGLFNSVISRTHSGDIIFAAAAATTHEANTNSFFVYPVVVVPAQERPRRYEGLNVDI